MSNEILSSGGSISGATFGSDDRLTVNSGTSSDLTVVSGGAATVFGTATDTTVQALGQLDVSAGGAAQVTTVGSGGTLFVAPLGSASDVTVRVKDLVETLDGAARPIVWLGRRSVDCRRHPNPSSVLPVRVRAHAFGRGRPCRDLFLSPDHALFLEDALIPVKYLLDGERIAQVRRHRVTYCHIELARHDVVLAEGLPAETYLDTGHRSAFENGGDAMQLHPVFVPGAMECMLHWEARGYAPLITTGPVLECARGLLRASGRKRAPAARLRRLAVAALAWLLIAPSAHAQGSLWNSYQGSTQVQLNYAPATGGQNAGLHYLGVSLSNNTPLAPSLSIGGGTSWTVDTGSEGMVITSDFLKSVYGIEASSFGKPSNQTITYTSSGLSYTGFYQNLNVGLYTSDKSGNGTLAATALQMPVFIATAYSSPVEQLGIGFGRGYPSDYPLQAGAPARADTDPLLNLTSVAGGNIQAMAPGYVVTSTSLLLGLTSAQLANTTFVKLLPISIAGETSGSAYQIAATANDWQTPAMTLGIANARPGTNGIYYGSLLVDTGLQNIELATGGAVSPNLTYNAQNPAQSSVLEVYLPGLTSSQGQPLSYTLLYQGSCSGGVYACPATQSYQNTVGLSPIYPTNSSNAENDGIDFVPASSPGAAFINTGANFLNYFNVVFDPVSGFIGYQASPDAQLAQSNPQAITAIALQGSVAIPAGTTITLPTFLFAEFTGGDGLDTNVQLSSPGHVTMAGPIASALYCFSMVCTATGLEIAAGQFVLTANNIYAGATVVDAGATLALGGVGSIATSSGVVANGVFDISATAAGAAIVTLSGAGQVNLGSQVLTLTNASGVFGGVIADGGIGGGVGGSLVIAGGTQILAGANTYTGGTTITQGATLAVNADAALGAPGAKLVFNNGTLLALGSIASTRPITVQSGGGIIDANGFTVSLGGPLMVDGPLTVSGPLTLAGALTQDNATLTAASLTVAAGATLRGVGTVNAPTSVAGTLAPGNSPGTLTVTAPVTMLPGSVTQLDIDGTGTGTGAGNYSRLLVTGAASSFTAAGTLAPLLRGITGSAGNTYTPLLGQGFVVVNAQGGVQGSYSGLSQPAGLAAGTRFDALYGAEIIALVVTPQSYAALGLAGIAETANQSAVGSALDAGRPAAGVAMTPAQTALFAPLYPLPASAIPGALESLAPTIDADAMMVWRDAWYLVGGAIGGAMETRRGLHIDQHRLWVGFPVHVERPANFFSQRLSQFVVHRADDVDFAPQHEVRAAIERHVQVEIPRHALQQPGLAGGIVRGVEQPDRLRDFTRDGAGEPARNQIQMAAVEQHQRDGLHHDERHENDEQGTAEQGARQHFARWAFPAGGEASQV